MVHVQAHQAVRLAGLGVFEPVLARVERSPVQGHVEFLHRAFIAAQVEDLLAVRAPRVALRELEFLLVHPVQRAVDHVVPGTVGGDGGLVHRGQVHGEEVVVAHKGRMRAVRAEGGQPLLALRGVRQGPQVLGGAVVHIVVGVVAVAVERFRGGLHHQPALVAAEAVPFDRQRGIRAGQQQVLAVQHRAVLAAASVGVCVHGQAPLSALQGGVVQPVLHAQQALHAVAAEGVAVPDGLVGKGLLGLCARSRAPGEADRGRRGKKCPVHADGMGSQCKRHGRGGCCRGRAHVPFCPRSVRLRQGGPFPYGRRRIEAACVGDLACAGGAGNGLPGPVRRNEPCERCI